VASLPQTLPEPPQQQPHPQPLSEESMESLRPQLKETKSYWEMSRNELENAAEDADRETNTLKKKEAVY